MCAVTILIMGSFSRQKALRFTYGGFQQGMPCYKSAIEDDHPRGMLIYIGNFWKVLDILK